MEVKKITESEENEIYLVISKALQSLCQEKPNDAIDFLSKKMLEIIGDDPKWAITKKKVGMAKTMKSTSDDVVISNERLNKKGYLQSFSDLYKIKKQITVGPKGHIYTVEDVKRSDAQKIVKLMKKSNDLSSLTLTELNISKLLALDHPNIGNIYDVLEDEHYVYLVQDYYEGGDLFNFLMKNKVINEKLLKIIIRQILNALKYLHENNICHRDLKPQNIFILGYEENDYKNILIKICDFGASSYFNKCVPLKKFPGNPFYCAPEVILRDYDYKCDIWSVGIILYFLINGTTPYEGKEHDVLFKILNSEINFDFIENGHMKNFLKKLLDKNPLTRPNSSEALLLEWLTDEDKDLIDDDIGVKIFSKMSKFILGDSLRRSVYSYIVSKKFYTESNSDLLKLFRECDINNDGKIDSHELLNIYGRYFPGTPEEQQGKIKEFIDRIDINKSGRIEYSEFLTVNNLLNNDMNKQMLKEVFDFFDVTKNGTIQKDDLREIFDDLNLDDDQINLMLKEFDKNNDDEISFAEFYEILTCFMD